MKLVELTRALGLEEKHVQVEMGPLPIVDASIYTTLGRRLFDFYKRYEIPQEDQREFERIVFVMMSFTLERKNSISLWQKILEFFSSSKR